MAIGIAAALLYAARKTLIVFLLAILCAYLLDPAIEWVHNVSPLSRQNRALAIGQVYVALAIVLGTILFWLGPLLISEGKDLGKTLPSLLDKITTGQVVWQLGATHGWSHSTKAQAELFIQRHRGTILTWVEYLGLYGAQLAGNVVWLVVIPILAIFFLEDGRKISSAGIHLLPADRQTFLAAMTEDLNVMLAHFIRSQIILAGLSTLVYGAALGLLRYPFALVLAASSGLMEFVPVVGPLAAGISILGVGILTGYPHLGLVALMLAAWRIVQDYLVFPRIMGGKLRLHPLAVIFAVMAGGEIAGLLGVYLSLPVMAALRIIWKWARRYPESTQVLHSTPA
jgi:predicted PurR-regulated permease PerM